MIAGVLVYNESTRETLFRSPHDYDREVVASLVQTFMRTQKSAFGSFTEHLNYVYTSRNNLFVCIITSFQPHVVQALLQTYYENMTASLIANLCLIDDTVNAFTFFPLPCSIVDQYLSMESQEEKLYDLVSKNKEAEMSQRLKEMRKKEFTDILDDHMEKVRELEIEIKKPVEHVVKKDVKEVFREKRRNMEVESDVQVLVRERLKVVVDRDAVIKSCEVDGDLSIVVRREQFSNSTVKIRSEGELKYSPNLDKELVKSGVLRGVKGFPVNKNLALVKWKKNKIDSLPVSFTFWPSEVENGRFQIMFEVSAEESLRDLIFCFNKEKIRDVTIEAGNAEVKDFLEWNVGTLEKNQNESLEFSCGCFSPSDLFPINLFFTGSFSNSPVSIEHITSDDAEVEFNLVNLCEVDSFVIVDE